MNTTLLWLLLLPVLGAAGIFIANKDDAAVAPACGAYFVGSLMVVLLGFFVSIGFATLDVEIINGQVTSKNREHGSYTRHYSCHCYTDSKGYQHCQTCSEEHYTVEWTACTTVGNIQIDYQDSTWRSVYNTPNPSFYDNIKQGDPAARQHSYTNYVLAVPNSLFTPSSKGLKDKFAGMIPSYPDNIVQYYNIDRVIAPGIPAADHDMMNSQIANGLRSLGAEKQVNIVLVISKTDDPNYEYAIRDAWSNGKKNDVVVVVGATHYPKIDFVRVISWTKNELFRVQLRDALQATGTVNENFIPIVLDQVRKNFERRHMSEFAYLKNEIDPPGWVIVLQIVLSTVSAVGVAIYMRIGNKQYSRFR